MEKRLFILVISFSLLLSAITLPFYYKEIPSLPGKVVGFYSSIGNFYLSSLGGSMESVQNLLGASAYFYKPLSIDTVLSYINFGELLIGKAERSVDGLASLGGLVLFGADKVFFVK